MLRWGVLGTGWIADKFCTALAKHTRQRLIAVGSREASRADAFARRFSAEHSYGSYEALVADPEVDIVYVATVHSEHAAGALLAIAAGKPVLVEKPFTRTVTEAETVFAAARSAGVAVMEAMWSRFLPHYDVLRQLVNDGTLGEIETLIADHGQWFAPDATHRLFDPAKAGGALLDLGVYPVSLAQFLLGTPEHIVAAGSPAFTGVDRQVSGILHGHRAHPHAHALITCTLAAHTPITATVSGTLARVEIPHGFYADQALRLITRDGQEVTGAPPGIVGHEGLCYEAAHFATLVAEGRTISETMSATDTLAVLTTMTKLLHIAGLELA